MTRAPSPLTDHPQNGMAHDPKRTQGSSGEPSPKLEQKPDFDAAATRVLTADQAVRLRAIPFVINAGRLRVVARATLPLVVVSFVVETL